MYLKARSRRVAIPVVDSVSQTYHFAPLQYSFRIKPPLKLQVVSVIIRSAMLRALHQGSLLAGNRFDDTRNSIHFNTNARVLILVMTFRDVINRNVLKLL